jgi:hypothetical protein
MVAPLHCRSLRRRGTPAGLPLPQRPPPPRQPKLAMTGPAELVTCDQTIERTIARLKQHRAIATRYDKLAVSYHTWLVLAALLPWLPT